MKKTLFGFVVLAIAFTFGTMMSCSEKVEEEVAIEATSVNDSIAEMVGDTVVLEGTVEHICQCTGTKMMFAGAEYKCVWDSVFDQALMGQVVRVKGVVCEKQTTADDINAMIAELTAKMQADSIAAANGEAKECCEDGEKHEGEHHCSAEHAEGDSACCPMMKLQGMLQQIAERDSLEGKAYLSEYYIQVLCCKPAAPAAPAE
ncbi:MAG: hypothetical protein MJ002_06895 [Paludibacteraceae bacterium]|nr:hypothetical protein [Paludibacteraceae bacterium]